MEYPVETILILGGCVVSIRFVVRYAKAEKRADLKFSPLLNSPEFGIIAVNGDRLRHV